MASRYDNRSSSEILEDRINLLEERLVNQEQQIQTLESKLDLFKNKLREDLLDEIHYFKYYKILLYTCGDLPMNNWSFNLDNNDGINIFNDERCKSYIYSVRDKSIKNLKDWKWNYEALENDTVYILYMKMRYPVKINHFHYQLPHNGASFEFVIQASNDEKKWVDMCDSPVKKDRGYQRNVYCWSSNPRFQNPEKYLSFKDQADCIQKIQTYIKKNYDPFTLSSFFDKE